ncbi:hypothetical protein PoB_001226800 [Plakobranchus ocellatus]|uniref:Uncharacterized protein n=1 Tax=Plakobranchus ocellatus TaxID=259542 RepID=A0AAV3YU50_9GAST|nr:hypothetical protein PoB_001226800 [Plakobranchus ocellatus]
MIAHFPDGWGRFVHVQLYSPRPERELSVDQGGKGECPRESPDIRRWSKKISNLDKNARHRGCIGINVMDFAQELPGHAVEMCALLTSGTPATPRHPSVISEQPNATTPISENNRKGHVTFLALCVFETQALCHSVSDALWPSQNLFTCSNFLQKSYTGRSGLCPVCPNRCPVFTTSLTHSHPLYCQIVHGFIDHLTPRSSTCPLSTGYLSWLL